MYIYVIIGLKACTFFAPKGVSEPGYTQKKVNCQGDNAGKPVTLLAFETRTR